MASLCLSSQRRREWSTLRAGLDHFPTAAGLHSDPSRVRQLKPLAAVVSHFAAAVRSASMIPTVAIAVVPSTRSTNAVIRRARGADWARGVRGRKGRAWLTDEDARAVTLTSNTRAVKSQCLTDWREKPTPTSRARSRARVERLIHESLKIRVGFRHDREVRSEPLRSAAVLQVRWATGASVPPSPDCNPPRLLRRIGKALRMRRTPTLTFIRDESIARGAHGEHVGRGTS